MNMKDTYIVGVDCAVDPRNVAVSVAVSAAGGTRVLDVKVCSRDSPPREAVVAALAGRKRALIAVDSPLGWPEPFGRNLARHQAGEVLTPKPNEFVRRQTDRVVKTRVGQQPLDVGADRIARTALAALNLLASVGETIGTGIDLAWNPEALDGIKAIEVYPAATLRAHGIPSRGYKKPQDQEARSAILASLRTWIDIECDDELLVANADALDAVVCALAASDFLRGHCFEPEDTTVAQKEGWIWVRDPDLAAKV